MNIKRRHPKLPAPRHLGIDIGRVIIHGDGPDTAFVGAGSDEEALLAPAMPGAFEAIARLVERFDGNVWPVSKCGKKIEHRSRRWLEHHGFHAATGIGRENLRFCRERRQKAGICVDLGIGFFVDDRIDVLTPMANLVPHRFLFGASVSTDSEIVATPDWSAAEAAIVAIVEEREATGLR